MSQGQKGAFMSKLLFPLVVVALVGAISCMSLSIGEADVEEASGKLRFAWAKCHEASLGVSDSNRVAANTVIEARRAEAATILRGDNTPAGEYPDPDTITSAQWQQAHDVYTQGIQELAEICPELNEVTAND